MDNNRIFLSLSKPGGFEQEYVQKALDSNWITSGGPNVSEFENRIENYIGNDSLAVALNSGTSAIHLALILLGVKSGDEVICQSMTFSASANPILYQGAIPVFVDSELETWNICPNHLETAIKDRIKKGKKPKAIIAVHIYGNPYKIDEIHAIADQYQIPIIEDSAEALGSTYKGKKCGTFGDFGIFSFNGNKIITASSGGALITKSKALKERAVFYANQAKDSAPHYQHSEIGYNYRMSNICAGIGLGQMLFLDQNVTGRREMHNFYNTLFENNKNVQVFESINEDYFSNYWLSTILFKSDTKNSINKENLQKAFDSANIECRPLWKPLHLQPIFNKYPYYGNTIAENLFENGLCLPSGANFSLEEKNRIEKVITDFFTDKK